MDDKELDLRTRTLQGRGPFLGRSSPHPSTGNSNVSPNKTVDATVFLASVLSQSTVSRRRDLMPASVSCEGTSPLSILVIPCPSSPPRSQPAEFAVPALLAIYQPQPSLCAARDSQPSPLAAEPSDLCLHASIHAPATAAWLPPGMVSIRADFVRASASDASSLASGVARITSLHTHPMAGGTGGEPRLPVQPLRGTFSLRGELMHAFVSYRVATEGPAGNGLSGLLAQKIRVLSMQQEGLKIPRHGW